MSSSFSFTLSYKSCFLASPLFLVFLPHVLIFVRLKKLFSPAKPNRFGIKVELKVFNKIKGIVVESVWLCACDVSENLHANICL